MGQIFVSALLQPVGSVCVSPSAFFISFALIYTGGTNFDYVCTRKNIFRRVCGPLQVLPSLRSCKCCGTLSTPLILLCVNGNAIYPRQSRNLSHHCLWHEDNIHSESLSHH